MGLLKNVPFLGCSLADPGGNPAMPPIMVLGGLAHPSQAVAGSVKDRIFVICLCSYRDCDATIPVCRHPQRVNH